jgi:pheromone shutdown protein TraB
MSDQLSSQEKIFLGWTARGFLNWSIKQSDDLEYLLSGEHTKRELFSIIVNKRNDVIVDYILSHRSENIVIVYGSLHFNGIYESLQRHETGWNIAHIETLKPYGY